MLACAVAVACALGSSAASAAPQHEAAEAVVPPPPAPALKPALPAQPAAASPSVAEIPPAASLTFAPEATALDEPARVRLSGIARELVRRPGQRLAIYAYAGGSPEAAAAARRTSLLRAVAVRSYLIDQGIASERMAVKALGRDADGGTADRVDIILSGR